MHTHLVCVCDIAVGSSTCPRVSFFFFFNDTATTEIYTLSLHDALPISFPQQEIAQTLLAASADEQVHVRRVAEQSRRSEEHTSELQSQSNLVCRLLLEKKKKKQYQKTTQRGHSTTRIS